VLGEALAVRPYVEGLCADLRKAALTDQGWNLRCHSVDLELDADRVVRSGSLNELVTNAAKHAFADRERGIIGVPLSSANGDLLLNMSEDGIGHRRERAN
jgi:two-component sensor histidine kinase